MENVKGTRDFLPEEKILRDNIIKTLKNIFEIYGFAPMETPALETLELLTAKGGAGRESDAYQEIYKFKDRAGRSLGLKFDQTLPLARVISANPQIKFPFKRYQIDRAWRNGPIKTGRYREFWQCDVDIIGCKNMVADAEIIALTYNAFKKLGLDVEIRINNRKLLAGLLEFLGIEKNKQDKVLIEIDKLDKISRQEIKNELEKAISKKSTEKLLKVLEGGIKEFEKIDNSTIKEGLKEIKEILDHAKYYKIKIKYVPYLVRGLGYYTGPIFEAWLKNKALNSALAGGGRYDKMVGAFEGKGRDISATGIAFGLDTIYETLKILGKGEKKKTLTKIYVIPIKTEAKKFLGIIDKLRTAGIAVDFDLLGKNLSKNLEYANKKEIPYVIFIGEKELKQKKLKLRDMKTGREKLLNLADVIKILK